MSVVWLAGSDLCGSATARTAASPTRVTVTIRGSRIKFAPSYVPTGAVLFKVFNRTRRDRDFGIGATRTGRIAAGRSATLAVTLAQQGERTFSSVPTARSGRLTGALYVFEPCTHPATTTVHVQIAKSGGGLTLSPTSVPCGTVTFVVTDTDAPSASLLVSETVPPVSQVTNQLDPGGKARLTVSFAAKGVVQCDAVEDDANGYTVVVAAGSLTLS